MFGRNIESLREDTPWTTPCVCHAIFVEGGIALAVATAACHGIIDPSTSFLIGEGLLFGWWMCGIYTGLFRQSLQKKYHLKVTSIFGFLCYIFVAEVVSFQGNIIFCVYMLYLCIVRSNPLSLINFIHCLLESRANLNGQENC